MGKSDIWDAAMRLQIGHRYAATNRTPLCGYKEGATMRLQRGHRYAATKRLRLWAEMPEFPGNLPEIFMI